MVGTNGVVAFDGGATTELHEIEALPEPDLSPAGRAVLERRFLAAEGDGPRDDARELFWRVAACIARGSAACEGEEAQARRRRDYYLAMARLEFLPSTATLANAGR